MRPFGGVSRNSGEESFRGTPHNLRRTVARSLNKGSTETRSKRRTEPRLEGCGQLACNSENGEPFAGRIEGLQQRCLQLAFSTRLHKPPALPGRQLRAASN